MESSGQGVDAYTVSILLKGLRRERNHVDADSADRALALMLKHKVRVDEVLVNAALEVFLCLRDANKVWWALDTINKSGWVIPKNCAMHTYGILIKAHGQIQQLDVAWRLWREITVEKGLTPSEQVYGQMIDVLVSNHRLDDALELLEKMKVAHHSASILVKLYGRCNDVDAAFRVLDELPQKYGFKPNAAVYTCLMSTCIANNRLDLALDLRLQMMSENVKCDEKTYTTLLRGAVRANEIDQCILLINAALDQGGRRNLDEEIVQNVLFLIQRRRMWDSHGPGLLERLRAAGVNVKCPSPAEAQARTSRQRPNGPNGSIAQRQNLSTSKL